MNQNKVRIAYCPTRRDVFSKEEAMRFNEMIKDQLTDMPVEWIDLEGINDEGLLYQNNDLPAILDRFTSAKADAVFFPHCNFGSENLVAQVAQALKVPVLLWGPRDDAPIRGLRSRDSQCGLFATGKVLRRHNVPFTYLVNSWINDTSLRNGFTKFAAAANVVKAMKNLRILQISTRPEPFSSVICNENELLEKFNIHLYPIAITDLTNEMDRIIIEAPVEAEETAALIRKLSHAASEMQIRKAAALKVALKRKAAFYGCRAIAMQCWSAFQDITGIMPCLSNALLSDDGIPTVCETDIHGAISAVMIQAAMMGNTVPFFADVTVRHPQDNNAELLWHCGNFPYSLAKNKAAASAGNNLYNKDKCFGICEWELKAGDITITRFDGDHGNYQLLIGEAVTTEGPVNAGSYVWIQTKRWAAWELKLVEGPYIHHVSGIHGKCGEILMEACKYIPELLPDIVEPSLDELLQRWD